MLSAALVRLAAAPGSLFRVTALLPGAAARAGAARARREAIVDLAGPGRRRARPHPRTRGRAGHRRRVRRLRVPVLRPGRAGDARAARRTRRRPLRLAPPAAERRPSARPAGGRGRGGGRRAGRVLGDARPAARPPGRPAAARPDAATPSSSASTSTASATTCVAAHGAERIAEDVDSRRPERRLRHADVLHQRPPPQRRLRPAERCPPRSGSPAHGRWWRRPLSAGGLRRCRADPLAQASTGAAAAAAPSVSSTSRISPDRQVKMGVSRSRVAAGLGLAQRHHQIEEVAHEVGLERHHELLVVDPERVRGVDLHRRELCARWRCARS